MTVKKPKGGARAKLRAHSETHKQRNAEAKKGNTFRRGEKHTPESIEKMKEAQKRWRLIKKLNTLSLALQEK